MNIQSLEFGSLGVNNRDDIPQYAFATDNPDVYFNTEMCREKGHVNGAGSCICRTSCPSSLDDLAAGKIYAVAAMLLCYFFPAAFGLDTRRNDQCLVVRVSLTERVVGRSRRCQRSARCRQDQG